MWKEIWAGLKGLAGSKKFQAAILSGIVWGVGKAGLHVATEDLVPIVGPIWGYIFGQGLADFGKSAAQLQAASSSSS